MKKLLFLAALATVILTNACKPSDDANSVNAEEIQLMKQFLTSTYGFKPESIQEFEDRLVVEGDQCFHMDHFWENFSGLSDHEFVVEAAQSSDIASDRKHYRYSYLVKNSKNVVITVLPAVPLVWRNALASAVSDWNALGGGLTFSIQYSTYSKWGTINVSMKNLPVGTYAEAFYPSSNGYPGSNLYINPYYTNKLNANSKTGVLAHEIGHTIGIRHTDSGQGTLITNVSTACKNNPDPWSVMSATGDFYYGFTTCDREAYKALYPK